MQVDSLFNPRSIAVIGASRDGTKVGHTIFQNCLSAGFAGRVYPVNPSARTILGKRCFKKIGLIGSEVDCTVIAVPADYVPGIVEECGQAGVKACIIISSGFSELDSRGARREGAVMDIARQYRMRILGPNCLGAVNCGIGLNASFAGELPSEGGISFVSHSGAMIVSLMDFAAREELGLQKLASIGNAVDVDEVELLRYLAEDAKTKVVGLYLEHISNPREFMRAAAAVAKKKRLAVLSVGSSARAQRAIQSHTGNLATPTRIVQTIVRQVGGVTVGTIEELFHLLKILSGSTSAVSTRTAIVTNAGGPAIMAVDFIASHGLTLGSISAGGQKKLRRSLSKGAAVSNPIDMLGDARTPDLRKVLAILDAERMVSNICVILTPQTVTPLEEMIEALAAFAQTTRKRVTVTLIGGRRVEQPRVSAIKKGLAVFDYPGDALQSLVLASRLSRPEYHDAPPATVSSTAERTPLPYATLQAMLVRAGLSVTKGRIITKSAEIQHVRSYPVVMKALSTDVIHKRQANAVELNIASARTAQRVFERMHKSFYGPGFEGILIQPTARPGLECIIGARVEEGLGRVAMLGLGGSLAETLNDVVFHVTPITSDDVVRMIKNLQHAEALQGYDTSFLARQLLKLVKVLDANKRVVEIECNPIILYAKGGTIVDARAFTV